jgi:hypothetical protein
MSHELDQLYTNAIDSVNMISALFLSLEGEIAELATTEQHAVPSIPARPASQGTLIIVTPDWLGQSQMKDWLSLFSLEYPAAFQFLENAIWTGRDLLKSGELRGFRVIYAIYHRPRTVPTSTISAQIKKVLAADPAYLLVLFVQDCCGDAQIAAKREWGNLDADVILHTNIVGLGLTSPEITPPNNDKGVAALVKWISKPDPPAK